MNSSYVECGRPGDHLSASENDYDWLGYGIYFWEFGPEGAQKWAVEQKKTHPKRIKKPAVIGAVIQLGTCFDLLDRRNTQTLTSASGTLLPQNTINFPDDMPPLVPKTF